MSEKGSIANIVQQILHVVRTERSKLYGPDASDELDAELARILIKTLRCKHPATNVGTKVPTNEFAMWGRNEPSHS